MNLSLHRGYTRQYLETKSGWRREALAASPVAICLIIPLAQIKGVVYVYDLFMCVAIFAFWPRRQSFHGNEEFQRIWRLFIIAVIMGGIVALLRTGGELRPIVYTMQYLILLLYIRVLYLNFSARTLSFSCYLHIIIMSALFLAMVGIIQFVLFQFNQALAEEIYIRYLNFSGFDSNFFENRYLAQVRSTGIVRVVGTWDVSTTFAGMLALSSSWLLFLDTSSRKKFIMLSMFAIAILVTGSRHAWVVLAVILIGLGKGNLSKMGAGVLLVCASILTVALLLGQWRSEDAEVMSFADQLWSRIDRTLEEGTQDRSLQLRYVEGTGRFFLYALKDPTMILWGLGTGTEKSLLDARGIAAVNELFEENYHYGFVSNGWLLIWRNWGIIGFAALFCFFRLIYRRRCAENIAAMIAVGLIIGADNYAVHVARCFFLVMVSLTLMAAYRKPVSGPSETRGNRYQFRPGRRLNLAPIIGRQMILGRTGSSG